MDIDTDKMREHLRGQLINTQKRMIIERLARSLKAWPVNTYGLQRLRHENPLPSWMDGWRWAPSPISPDVQLHSCDLMNIKITRDDWEQARHGAGLNDPLVNEASQMITNPATPQGVDLTDMFTAALRDRGHANHAIAATLMQAFRLHVSTTDEEKHNG